MSGEAGEDATGKTGDRRKLREWLLLLCYSDPLARPVYAASLLKREFTRTLDTHICRTT